MKYIKQLDAVRAIAVILVIISHWIPKKHALNTLENGVFGVSIFFVLSGFLITAILLSQRQAAKDRPGHVLRNFYFRRSLRIFPIYYLAVAILFLFRRYAGEHTEGAFAYHLTYTSNFYFFGLGHWDGAASHFWSLAVEEQFYLVWPWLMLFVPQKGLLPVMAGFIGIGIGSQYLLASFPLDSALPITCLDAFGLGGLLAWTAHYRPNMLPRFCRLALWGAGLGVCSLLLDKLLLQPLLPPRTAYSLIGICIISYVVVRQENVRMKWLWNNPALVSLGKVSYGLYLYHPLIGLMLMPYVVEPLLHPLLPVAPGIMAMPMVQLAEKTVLLLLACWVSYRFIEMPFLRLKKHFGYRKPAAAGQRPQPAVKVAVVAEETLVS